MSTKNFAQYYTLFLTCSLTPICHGCTQHVANGLETCYGALHPKRIEKEYETGDFFPLLYIEVSFDFIVSSWAILFVEWWQALHSSDASSPTPFEEMKGITSALCAQPMVWSIHVEICVISGFSIISVWRDDRTTRFVWDCLTHWRGLPRLVARHCKKWHRGGFQVPSLSSSSPIHVYYSL